MNEQIHIFDRHLVRRHRDRAAAHFTAQCGALFQETAALIQERLDDVRRDFPVTLDLGAHDGCLAKKLSERPNHLMVAAELSEKMLVATGAPNPVVTDEELLPFQDASFDLVVSNLSLHWVNDLPGCLAQIKRVLKPDGLFLATLLGGETLYELRTCMLEAELLLTNGISPRLSPSIDMQTASALLQRAGFNLPVTDHEIFTFTYSSLASLMRDLRGMGESNAHGERSRTPLRREVFTLTEQLYQERFANADGRLPATFDVIFMHGWN